MNSEETETETEAIRSKQTDRPLLSLSSSSSRIAELSGTDSRDEEFVGSSSLRFHPSHRTQVPMGDADICRPSLIRHPHRSMADAQALSLSLYDDALAHYRAERERERENTTDAEPSQSLMNDDEHERELSWAD